MSAIIVHSPVKSFFHSITAKIPHSKQEWAQATKSAAAVAALALTTFGAMILAHYMPGTYILTTLSISILNLSLLPKILQLKNVPLMATVLLTSAIAVGSLILGGMMTFSAFLVRQIISQAMSLEFGLVLFCSFLLTGAVGYGMSFGLDLLKETHQKITDPEFLHKLKKLSEQIIQLPQHLKRNVIQKFFDAISAFIVLAYPKQSLAMFERLGLKPAAWIIKMAAHFSGNSVETFKQVIDNLKNLVVIYQHTHVLPNPSYLEGLYQVLSSSLESLEDNKLKQSLVDLESNLMEFTPRFLTHAQASALFNLNHVKQVLNIQIQKLNEAAYEETLPLKIATLKKDMEQLEKLSANDIDQWENIKQQFNELKKEIADIYSLKQRLRAIFNAPRANDVEKELGEIFEDYPNYEVLSVLLKNGNSNQQNPDLNRIDQLYQETSGLVLHANQDNQSCLHALFRQLGQKFENNPSNEQETDKEPSFIFLGANTCEFKGEDFIELAQWLKVELDEDLLQEKLKEIGLETAEDLYAKRIVLKDEVNTKESIKANLKIAIENALKPNIRTRLYKNLANLSQISPNLKILSHKVSKVVYRLITMGLILVPVILHPLAASIGFAGGIIYFSVQRFARNHSHSNSDLFNFGRTFAHSSNRNVNRLGNIMTFLAGRNLLSLTPQTIQQMETFAQADFFGKMRLINMEIFVTMIINYFAISGSIFEPTGAGSIFQGAALGREIVNWV